MANKEGKLSMDYDEGFEAGQVSRDDEVQNLEIKIDDLQDDIEELKDKYSKMSEKIHSLWIEV